MCIGKSTIGLFVICLNKHVKRRKWQHKNTKTNTKFPHRRQLPAPPNNLVPLNSGERTSKIFTDRSSMQAMSYVQGFLAQYLLSIIKS
jgi:hypothetical protein